MNQLNRLSGKRISSALRILMLVVMGLIATMHSSLGLDITIGNQETLEDESTGPVSLGIGNISFLGSVTVEAVSLDNTTLLPNGNITITGSGAGSKITMEPAADLSGLATVRVTATDLSGSVERDFVLTVKPVNEAPSFTVSPSSIPDVSEDPGLVTLSNWASVDSFGPGDENTQSVSAYLVTNVSEPDLFASGPSVDTNGNLTYTPAANANGTSTFDVALQDNGGTDDGGVDKSPTQTFSITVLAVNDAPIIEDLGTVLASIDDKATEAADRQLFGAITITDVDFDDTIFQVLGVGDLTVAVTVGPESLGEFDASGLTGTGLEFSFDGTPDEVTDILRNLLYTPVENVLPVATHPDAIAITIDVDDGDLSDSEAPFVDLVSVNDPAAVDLSIDPATIYEGQSLAPFDLAIVDPDFGETFDLVITPMTDLTVPDLTVVMVASNGDNTFTGASHGFEDGDTVTFTTSGVLPTPLVAGDPYYVISSTTDTLKVSETLGGSSINIVDDGTGILTVDKRFERLATEWNSFVGSTSFLPTASGDVTFTFTVTEIHPSGVFEAESVVGSDFITVLPVNAPPEIAGVNTTLIRLDGAAAEVNPFSGISIDDPNSDNVVVTISFAGGGAGVGAFGTFPTTDFTATFDAVENIDTYTLSATTTELAETKLRALTFTAVDTAELTMTLTVDDEEGGIASNSRTRIAIGDVELSPALTGLADLSSQPVQIARSGEVHPFGSASITDPDSSSLTVTVTFSDAEKGTLVNTGIPIVDIEDSSGDAVIFSPGHELSDDDLVRIVGNGGSPSYDGVWKVVIPDANHIALVDVATSAAATFVAPPADTELGNWTKVLEIITYAEQTGIPENTLVESIGHGLVTGSLIELFETGDPAYDGQHEVTVVDEDFFTIPVAFGVAPSTPGFFFPVFLQSGSEYVIEGSISNVTFALRALGFSLNPDFHEFPPGSPIALDFAVRITDSETIPEITTLSIELFVERRNHLVVLDTDGINPADGNDPVTGLPLGLPSSEWGRPQRGTLRRAIADAAADDMITFALPVYSKNPITTIRLNEELVLSKNVTINGPGADLLAISGDTDGNSTGDVRIFNVDAAVEIHGLTLTKGWAGTGGAIYVGSKGKLALSYCAVTESRAALWGGGIDVNGGSLIVENSLILGNAVDKSRGLGGGGVSIFSNETCSFTNTTFSGNRQQGEAGVGGGALYVENESPRTALTVNVSHATFAENFDSAELGGSSIYANVFGTTVAVSNTIFADGQERNLQVDGAGRIVSLGGNLSDDATRAILTQSGAPKAVVLLDQDSDQTRTNPLLLSLSDTVGPTRAYGLEETSPALNAGVSPGMGVDQRGVIRNAQPDSGAIEGGTTNRISLNELQTNGTSVSAPVDFVEFYVQGSDPFHLDDFTLWANGKLQHTFAASTTITPGFGIIVDQDETTTPADMNTQLVAAVLPDPLAVLDLPARGLIELRDAAGLLVLRASYVDEFVDPDDLTMVLSFPDNSITLAPQFSGFAYLPSSAVLGPPLGGFDEVYGGSPETPGSDTGNRAFGSGNASPFAVDDFLLVSEDDPVRIAVGENDLDADDGDQLLIVDVSADDTSLGADVSVTTGFGARATILPSIPGGEIQYDPLYFTAPDTYGNLQTLSEGEEAHDVVYYQIKDYDALGGAKSPSTLSQARVNVTVFGVNDPPIAVDESFVTDEDTVIRILGDPELTSTGAVFDTDDDYSTEDFPDPPTILTGNLLANADDIDSDDTNGSVRIVGVLAGVNAITDYSGVVGEVPVTVQSAGHGLASGTEILVSRYGGHPSYNGYHMVSVIDEDTFTLPVAFVENDAAKGEWAILNDANRLSAVTDLGAEVNLEIRDDRRETNVVYNPRSSSALNSLGVSVSGPVDTEEDCFYYAVEDRHGAVTLAKVKVDVSGVNDTLMPVPDPGSLAELEALMQDGQTLEDVIASLDVSFVLPPMSETDGRVDAQVVLGEDGTEERVLIKDIWITDEDTELEILTSDLLANDADVDSIDIDEMQLSVTLVDSPSRLGAEVELPAPSTITYDPRVSTVILNALAREELVIDTFEITVSDTDASVTTLVSVIVVGANDQPRGIVDAASTTEDDILTLDASFVLGNDEEDDIDSNAPDDVLSLVPVMDAPTAADGGLINILDGEQSDLLELPVGTIIYDPTGSDADPLLLSLPFDAPITSLNNLGEGQSVVDTYEYTVTDGSFVFANDDLFKVQADNTDLFLDVLANDRNLIGTESTLTIVSVTDPNNEGVAVVGTDADDNPGIIYSPQPNFVGDDVFLYTVEDDEGNSDSGLVVVQSTVNQLNGNLQANDDFFTAAKGQSPVIDVLANDNIIPDDGAGLTIDEILSTPALPAGDEVILEGNQITFVQGHVPASFPYTVTFRYQISGGGTASAIAEVSLKVIDREGILNGIVNGAYNEAYDTLRDDAVGVLVGSSRNAIDVLANDNILPGPGDALTISGISDDPNHGEAEISEEGDRLLYTPDPGFTGIDTLTYDAADAFGGSGSAQVTITVGALTTNADLFAVPAAPPINFTAVGGILTAADHGFTSGDLVTFTSTGALPAGLSAGMDYFVILLSSDTFNVSETEGGTPVAVTSAGTGVHSAALVYDLDVLANDQVLELNNGSLEVIGVSPLTASIGAIHVSDTGASLRFVPGITEGEFDFTYTVGDQNNTGLTAAGVVTVVVRGAGVAANPDAYTVSLDSTDNRLDVLGNDVAIPDLGKLLTISSAGQGGDAPDQGGTVRINDDNTLSYTPAPGYEGEETFGYTMTDSRASDSAKVVVNVSAGALSANPDAYTVFFVAPGMDDEGNNIYHEFTLAVLSNDLVLPDFGQNLTITGVGIDDTQGESNAPDMLGSVEISPDGTSLIYAPRDEGGDAYTEQFTYVISDGTARRAEAQVVVEVLNRSDVREMETNDDAFTIERNSAGNILAVLANDHVKPADAANWSITGVSSVTPVAVDADLSNDVVTISGQTILYTPEIGFVGTKTFTYDVSDGLGGTGMGTVSVKVGDLKLSEDAFVAISDSVFADNVFNVLANDAVRPDIAIGNDVEDDEPNEAIDFVLSGLGMPDRGGSVEIDSGGNMVRYAPDPDYPDAGGGYPFDPLKPYPYQESFTYEVIDGSGALEEGTAVVTVYKAGSDRSAQAILEITVNGVNDAPTIDSSGATILAITDKTDGMPFDGVMLIEVDKQGQQQVKVVVVIDDPMSGVFTNLNGFVEVPPGSGIFEFTGTAEEAMAALQGLTFIPMENWVMVTDPSVAENFGFGLSIMDIGVADPLTTTDTSISIDVTAVNDIPRLFGVPSALTVYHRGEIEPFAGAIIEEDDDHEQQQLTVDVAVGDVTHGYLLSLSSAFVDQGGGVYRFVGTAEDATTALGELIFVPTADRLVAGLNPVDSEETQLDITVDDGFGGTASGTTTVKAIHGYIGEFSAGDGSSNDNMGWSVAASRDFVVAGAPNENENGSGAGAAYVFAPTTTLKDEWQQNIKLIADDGARGDAFGTSVDVDGSFIVVGAPGVKTGADQAGAAYVFNLQGSLWVEVAKLIPLDGASSDEFGFSVAISGDLIVVGAHLDDDDASGSGSVYVYENQGSPGTWNYVAKLKATTPQSGAEFGFSVDVSGDTIIAGAPFSSLGGEKTGSAYVFEKDSGSSPATWSEVAQLVGEDSVVSERLGYSVGIDGSAAVAGAPLHDQNGTKTGAAYVFEDISGWSQVRQLLPPNGQNTDEFGFSVDISGDDIVVGMHNDGDPALNQSQFGSAFIFNRIYGLIDTIVSLTPSNNDEVGFSVAIGGHTAAIGIPFDNPGGIGDAGGVIIYRLKYNNDPVARIPIDPQFAYVSQDFDFEVPTSAFGDPDLPETLTLTASGTPGWLDFDPVTNMFSGEPLAGDLGSTDTITLEATDDDGLTAQTSFTLTVLPASPLLSDSIPAEIVEQSQPSISLTRGSGSSTSGGEVTLRFYGQMAAANSEVAFSYSVEFSEDLIDWHPADGVVTGGEFVADKNLREITWKSIQSASQSRARFYRIRVDDESTDAGN